MLLLGTLTAAAPGFANDSTPVPHSATVLGSLNPLLTRGSEALQAGRFEEGVRLTLEGLEQPAGIKEKAAAHSNICAGLVGMKRWQQAIEHCNRALELDRTNWRTFNNRAAAFVGLKEFDLAMTDVNTGLDIAPGSTTLLKSKEVVKQHRKAYGRERWRRPDKA
jgi:tetratricopeptide (TPR) repeat protein